ncbi:MAG TPA: hypothetical protein VGE30_02775 [Candidatus Saccharimonadales bacterium]
MNSTQLHVGGWNILLDVKHGDKVPPQAQRLEALAYTIETAQQRVGRRFDYLGILEAQKTEDGQNGDVLAAHLGYEPGVWHPHSRIKSGEHLGLIGTQVCEADFMNLPTGKMAAMAWAGSVLFTATHFRFQLKGKERSMQAAGLMEQIGDVERGVLFLDPNCLAWQEPRRIIEAAGYRSVFELTGRAPIRTALTNKTYRRAMLSIPERLASGRGLWVDDIYVKGLDVLDAYALEGESDHSLVGALIDTGDLQEANSASSCTDRLNLVQHSNVRAE